MFQCMVVTMEHSEQIDVLPGGADTFNNADQLLLQLCMFGLCLLLDIFRKSLFCQDKNLTRKIGETAHYFIVEGVNLKIKKSSVTRGYNGHGYISGNEAGNSLCMIMHGTFFVFRLA